MRCYIIKLLMSPLWKHSNPMDYSIISNHLFQHDPVELPGALRYEGGGQGGLGDGRVVALALDGVST